MNRSRIVRSFASSFSLLCALAACGSGTYTPPRNFGEASPPPGASSAAPSSTPTRESDPAASSATPGSSAAAKGTPRDMKIGARHVLIQWMGCERAPMSVVRTRDQARSVADEVLRRARGGEDLGRLAVEYSDEPGAVTTAGALGRFGRGAMDKRFEEAAFALKPGEISGVVESAFGFHIIQRTE